MRIVFLGTGDFAVPALRALVAAGHTLVAAISQPDRPAGRSRAIVPTPVHAAADELHIPHIQAEDVNTLDIPAVFGPAEIGVVAAFGQKIGQAILGAPRLGCVNIHGSLLPRYRGAAPYQWAVINGDDVTGVTVFQLDERWDAGEIWSQREVPIGETQTADELHDELAKAGAELIAQTLPLIAAGQVRPRLQDPTQATRAPKLSRADSAIDWTQPAARIARRINGLWSWPAATCVFADRDGRRERVQLARAQAVDRDAPPTADLPPGAFCQDITVQTGAGRVRLLEIKPAGGRLMPFDAYARGRHIAPPDRLLPVEPPSP